jgi:hypothetical protein
MTIVPTEMTGVEAPGKQRFRAERILWSALTENRPDRGLVVSNPSGRYQLYAWQMPAGDLRQLTDRPEGILSGFIDSLARHVYYLDDRDGNEIGHLVRVPFGGGEPENTSPNLPAYSTWGGAISETGNRLAFTRADQEGFTLTAIDLGPNGEMSEPRDLYRSEQVMSPPVLSPEGDLAVVASAERSAMQHYTLLAFDTLTGERVAELWDGRHQRGVRSVCPSPGGERRSLAGRDLESERLRATADLPAAEWAAARSASRRSGR